MFPYYAQHGQQQIHMNPYNGIVPNSVSEPVSAPVPMYHQQPTTPSAPLFSTNNQYGQPSTSSGLYPQFN